MLVVQIQLGTLASDVNLGEGTNASVYPAPQNVNRQLQLTRKTLESSMRSYIS